MKISKIVWHTQCCHEHLVIFITGHPFSTFNQCAVAAMQAFHRCEDLIPDRFVA